MKKLLLPVLCLMLAACTAVEKNPMAVAEELLEYRDMTYGEFKEETGVEAEMLHANRFYAPIPDTEYTVVFLAEKLNEEEMVYEGGGQLKRRHSGFFSRNDAGGIYIKAVGDRSGVQY